MLATTAMLFAGDGVDAAESTEVPVAMTTWVPCALDGAGEIVVLEGQLHVTVHSTQRSGTEWVTVTGFNPQGVIGTGQVSGDVYRGTGHTGAREISSVTGARVSLTNHFGLIGPGPGNNLLVHATWHVTQLADGSLVRLVDNISINCR